MNWKDIIKSDSLIPNGSGTVKYERKSSGKCEDCGQEKYKITIKDVSFYGADYGPSDALNAIFVELCEGSENGEPCRYPEINMKVDRSVQHHRDRNEDFGPDYKDYTTRVSGE